MVHRILNIHLMCSAFQNDTDVLTDVTGTVTLIDFAHNNELLHIYKIIIDLN